MKFKVARIHFLSDVFLAVAVVVKLPKATTTATATRTVKKQ